MSDRRLLRNQQINLSLKEKQERPEHKQVSQKELSFDNVLPRNNKKQKNSSQIFGGNNQFLNNRQSTSLELISIPGGRAFNQRNFQSGWQRKHNQLSKVTGSNGKVYCNLLKKNKRTLLPKTQIQSITTRIFHRHERLQLENKLHHHLYKLPAKQLQYNFSQSDLKTPQAPKKPKTKAESSLKLQEKKRPVLGEQKTPAKFNSGFFNVLV